MVFLWFACYHKLLWNFLWLSYFHRSPYMTFYDFLVFNMVITVNAFDKMKFLEIVPGLYHHQVCPSLRAAPTWGVQSMYLLQHSWKILSLSAIWYQCTYWLTDRTITKDTFEKRRSQKVRQQRVQFWPDSSSAWITCKFGALMSVLGFGRICRLLLWIADVCTLLDLAYILAKPTVAVQTLYLLNFDGRWLLIKS